MIPLSESTKRRIGFVLVALIELGVLVSVTISVWLDDWPAVLEVLLLGLTFGAVIALSLRAQPANGAVWALVWAAAFGLSSDLGSRVAVWRADLDGSDVLAGEIEVAPSEIDLLAALGLIGELALWIPGIYLLGIHALVLFPGGRAVSRAWRIVLQGSVAVMAWLTVVSAWRVAPWQDRPYDEIVHDRFGVAGAWIYLMGPLQLIAIASLVHLVRRYRRSTGEERVQFRWVVWALALFVVHLFAYGVWDILGVDRLASTLFLANIAVAFGIAIVKNRLFDIDVVISKSVTYLGLAAAITALYASVVVVPLLVIGATDDEGPGLLLPIVATAVVALLFEPIRKRMQRWANRLVYGDRASPHEVLSQVTARLSDAPGSAGIDDLARLMAEGTGADHAVVWMRSGEMLRAEGMWSGGGLGSGLPPMTEALVVDDFTEAVSVRHEGEELGAVSISKPHNDPVTPADRELLGDVAAGAALLLRNMRLNNELEQRADDVRDSRRRLIAAQDAERHRLERDLHDGAQQQVVALKVKLGIAKTLAQREGADEIATRIIALADETQHAVDALREVAHGIYPPLLESDGLEPALRAVQRSASLPIAMETSGLARYARPIEETTYFCVLETLERARMAGAKGVQIGLEQRNGHLIVEVDLDGGTAEIDLSAVTDRIDAADGALQIGPTNNGTRMVVELPTGRAEAT